MSSHQLTREIALVTLAMVLVGLAVATLSVIALTDFALAGWLVREDGVVECLQAAACFFAALVTGTLAVASLRRGADAPLDIVVSAMTTILVIGEMDLDKRFYGVKLIATRFFVNPAYSRSIRALVVAVVVGIPVLLGIYALVRRRELWTAGLEELRHPTGWMLLSGVVLLGLVEVFERQIGHIPGPPRYFLEEVLELTATFWMLAGVTGRWLRVREAARMPATRSARFRSAS